LHASREPPGEVNRVKPTDAARDSDWTARILGNQISPERLRHDQHGIADQSLALIILDLGDITVTGP
jgi:hypothetical protein